MPSIAVLLTCFNRKPQTLKCLESLYKLNRHASVFLVDDNSSDGTFQAVAETYPQVKLIEGDGKLFWNRGMYLAWTVAAKQNFDYYLWLNDDVVLHEYSLNELMECVELTNDQAIISGIIVDQNNKVLYGGSNKNRTLIIPNGELQDITYLNGNVVMVPKSVFETLGNLDPKYHHDMGDVDYGFRASAHGIKVYSTRKAIAFGEKNPICRERQSGATINQRFKRLYSPLGSNPKLNFYFRKKYKSIFNATGYYIFQHLLNLIPDNLNTHIFGNKYK